MSEPTSTAVECPICGASFDPTAAGGWCTNPDCGEWQYVGEEVPEPAPAGGGEPTPADDEIVDPDEGPADRAEAAEDDPAATDADEDDDPAEASGVEPPADDGAADEDVDEAVADVDDAVAAGDEDEGADTAETERCPECGEPVDADDNFCASCGAELAAAEPTLDACPGCGDPVEAEDSFCANCGEDLEAARAALGKGDGDDAAVEWESAAEADADELVLRVRGEEIAVGADETVGREVRRIVTETDGSEDEAVRIHREHVRFVREDGTFYLVDLGDNPTALNDHQLSKGDREPVEPGDEIELSGVATLTVEAA